VVKIGIPVAALRSLRLLGALRGFSLEFLTQRTRRERKVRKGKAVRPPLFFSEISQKLLIF
jgi:hypothetical protein